MVKAFELTLPRGELEESEYYGSYNAILSHLFPIEEDYLVVPQYKRPKQSRSVDFTTVFIVRHQKYTVFFIEVKASGHIQHISSREEADPQCGRDSGFFLRMLILISCMDSMRPAASCVFIHGLRKLAEPCQHNPD